MEDARAATHLSCKNEKKKKRIKIKTIIAFFDTIVWSCE